MGRIAGIIYPNLFQVGKTILPMLKVQEAFNEDWNPSIYTHETTQLGQTQEPITFNQDKTLILAIDGKIWNKKELIEHLQLTEFATTGDIFIKAYEKNQLEFLKLIDGDFAFALFDSAKKRLILGRDRVGKKPLYWFQNQLHFLFASELKALMVTGIVPQTVALDGIASYLALGYFPQDMSPIEGVNKLLPGYYLIVEKDSSVHIRSYWSLSQHFSTVSLDSKEEIVKKLKRLVDQAVEKRIPDQESTGCFVSGGLGSASIALKLRKTSPTAYTCGFSGQNESDVQASELVCQTLDLKQKLDWITPSNFLDDLVPILWQLDEPLADPNIIATWNLAKMNETGIVFSGMGSDEMLAGHSRYTILERYVPPFNRLLNNFKRSIKKKMIPLFLMLRGDQAFKYLKHSQVNPFLEQYVVQNQLFSFKYFNFLSPEISKLFDPDLFLQKFHNISKIPTIASACAYLDIKTRLPDQYILQYDRFSSAFGLDWRTPYLDTDFIEYAASIPEPDEGGSYLKELFATDFPPEFIERTKRTRRTFLHEWVDLSQLKDLFPLLKNGTLVNTGLITKSWVEKMCETEETMESTFRYLFSVFILELWFRLYINRPFTLNPPELKVKDLLLEP